MSHASAGVPRGAVLSADEVHVWKVSADCVSADNDWLLLSKEERQRALALRSPSDRLRWIRAHVALRDVLRRYVGDGPPLRFKAGRFGKPELEDSQGLRFNLAHSGQWALIAVARGRDVGVDVEEVRAVDVDSIMKRWFSPAERAAVDALAGQARLDTFCRFWTRKEAFVKGLGVGLHVDIAAVDVSANARAPIAIAVRQPALCASPWMVTDITLDSRHKAAVAVEGETPISYRLLEWRPPIERRSKSARVHQYSRL